MPRSTTFVALLGVVAIAIAVLRYGTRPDPTDDPALSLPPPLLAAGDVRGRIALFDGRDLAHWKIEGRRHVADGTFVLGEGEVSVATVLKTLEEGEALEFDF